MSIQKWEYLTVDYVGRPMPHDGDLNKLGSDGWELVSDHGGQLRFKRPLPKELTLPAGWTTKPKPSGTQQ